MFICLVGQTPITALAEGDDTRVISVPEGLQEVLINETPEIQTVETEDTIEDTNEVQGEDAIGEAQGENATAETPDVQTQEDATVENPENQTVQEDVTVETPDDQTVHEDATVDTPDAQTVQEDVTAETPNAQTTEDTTAEAPEIQTVQEEIPEFIEEISLITETNLTASIVASDGNTYETNVKYTNESGIPMEGTKLQVTELVSEDEGYDEYIEESASKVGVDTKDIVFSKVFDIKIVDENDENIEYEPTGNVDVSIRVVGVPLDEIANLNVLHFVEDKNDENYLVYDVDTIVNEETVEFSTDSFSVYVVIGHENDIVENPRVKFHFISNIGVEEITDSTVYYKGNPYIFKNKNEDDQTTQILKDGESLELFADPENQNDKYFYGWYVVDPKVISGITDDYGIGTSDQKLYYTWPGNPDHIIFESPISITAGSNVKVGDIVGWELNGVSGSGTVDKDGNVNVFLAPIFENYHFINFMLRPRGETPNNLMTRKMIALGSATSTDVKISDIRSSSTDPVHLVFVGWEYYDNTLGQWVQKQTVDSSGATLIDPPRDGIYLQADMTNTDSIDLYPLFTEARWVDFFAGISGSGASYVPSRFLEAWGRATTPETSDVVNQNVFTTLSSSKRTGYTFDGWYAFAQIHPVTGEITNLDTPADVEVSYVTIESTTEGEKYITHKLTVNTTAVQISNPVINPDDESVSVYNSGIWSVTDNGDGTGVLHNDDSGYKLFEASNGKLRFFDPLDRLKLSAKWASSDSQITVVYWTENAQEEGYIAPADPKNNYTAAAVEVVHTTDLNSQLGTSLGSGSELFLDTLRSYADGNRPSGILETEYLNDIGAVLSGEEKFYDLNTTLSDASVIIKGDGSTTYNVYYERKTFKLVFHIGRDHYLKNRGNQKETTSNWLAYPNWIEYMYNDAKVTQLLNRDGRGGTSYYSKTGDEYNDFVMRYYPLGKTDAPGNYEEYDSSYETTLANISGSYVPDTSDSNDQKLYIIEAKYGAYIGNKWPSPSNTEYFSFTETWRASNDSNKAKTLYIWTAYYDTLYTKIANGRSTAGNPNGNNPDVNGVYEYMSAELCTNRAGDGVVNNQVHHLVAYFGEATNQNRFKNYHVYYEAIDGTYDPTDTNLNIKDGDDFEDYKQTTWCAEKTKGDKSAILGNHFIKISSDMVLSNVEPQFQLSDTIDGYELVYSCYDNDQPSGFNNPQHLEYNIHFFYRPKQYTLTFNIENNMKEDSYYYTQSLADANKYTNEVVVPNGYYFAGWYTNAEGIGQRFDFENEKMPSQNVVLYPVLKVLQYTVKIDPNGGVLDHRENTSVSTYFTGDYGTPVGEYTTDREFIKITDKELPTYSGDKYYYINTQRKGVESEGNWGLPAELRNAVYVKESEIDTYYNWYSSIFDDPNFDWNYWEGVQKLSKQDFIDTYADYYYRPVNGEHYTFMGWYKVQPNGSVASMPYNFNDPLTGPLELRAMWRLEGGYYVQYNPYYFDEENGNVTAVIGQLNTRSWFDPEDPSIQLYADQAPMLILHAPTNVTSGWVFRGWRVVKQDETEPTKTFTDNSGTHTYINWVPYKDLNYYQPGENFIIDSELSSESNSVGNVIHMQAFYEREDTSHRRPEVTNLTLDPNQLYGGSIVNVGNSFPSLGGPGNQDIKYESGNPVQILIGDVQSNLALHLNGYADFFSNDDKYLLIGFDENTDPTSPKTGKAYIPTFALDSVAGVTRESDDILYAMWEPMVYATFINTTDEDLEIDLSGTGGTISIINEAKGFDRKAITTHITVPKKENGENGIVKVVLPGATPGIDLITAETTNNHPGYKLSVNGVFKTENPYGMGDQNVQYGDLSHYTGTLNTDPDGIIITYTEEEIPSVIFDKNGADVWNEQSTWFSHSQTDEDIYIIQEDGIAALNRYKPADPQRNGKIFLGWTTNADIAAQTDFSSEVPVTLGSTSVAPDSGDIILNKIKSDYLWDFEDNPPYGRTLYAVWSDTVTVSFDIKYNGSKLHTWKGPGLEQQALYCFYESATGIISYSMAKGEYVPKPADPSPHTDKSSWGFLSWLYLNGDTQTCRSNSKKATDNVIKNNTFDFTQRILSNVTLVTSWGDNQNLPQYFTFTVLNQVVGGNPEDEFEYTIEVLDELCVGKISGSPKPNENYPWAPNEKWGSFPISLKNNQEYTVAVKVVKSTVYSPPVYNVIIDVIDSNGVIVNTGSVFFCSGNTQKYFTSDYKYTLKITQTEKSGYDTTVDKQITEGTIEAETNNQERSFTFTSCESGMSKWESQFPEENAYNPGSNSMTVVFTNEGRFLPAPTSYTTNYKPFFMMFGFGAILVGLIVPPVIMFRRRREEEE